MHILAYATRQGSKPNEESTITEKALEPNGCEPDFRTKARLTKTSPMTTSKESLTATRKPCSRKPDDDNPNDDEPDDDNKSNDNEGKPANNGSN